ncbi:pyrroloquinoline-quinone synthase PqqC [Cupriavidus alkaliphilus]|uniref:Pyrroloquinoline-quinone synthase n=1 Tax=Cupriavidus alkaliphilus TaxID=942866 RepID=A0A7W4YRM1_9BURK|nr:pyrroloquinoline-quinone synthase PqqC [Cupriavidus alkaliphilus]MBB3008970.1 pyrroloquinoline-quinone synthase [Cupriavidus alkaliphilus]PVY79377.1 pyrroloquinoline-quinone synthase [Cupriavidus alkaliphilus]
MTATVAWTPAEFEARLRARESGYHIHHPFNRRMAAGQCTPAQIRTWVANRFYYQASIPLKDAAILSNCPDRATRREWVVRILDHDGTDTEPGGIEAWLRLGQAVGLERDALLNHRQVLPGVRFAVDAYVNFARRAPWQEAVCSSLTEMFAPKIHQERLAGWPTHYPWIEAGGLDYFRSRIPLAQRDVDHGLRVTLDHFRSAAQQQRALDILQFKLDVLWSMLDAIQQAQP